MTSKWTAGVALITVFGLAMGQAAKDRKLQLESGAKLAGQTRTGKGQTRLTQAAVMYGLVWLARHQAADGSWSSAQFADQCSDASCTGTGHVRFTDGLTGLSLLAFLSAGYAPGDRTYADDPK